MDERGANIDIVFRNGLKDYEVLPPAEVWDNIHPVIRKKQRPFVLIRAAALITIVLSMSFLAYRWSREISTSLEGTAVVINKESLIPVNNQNLTTLLTVPEKEEILIQDTRRTVIENARDLKSVAIAENNTFEVVASQEIKSLPVDDKSILNEPPLITLYPTLSSPYSIEDFAEQYDSGDQMVKSTERWSIAAMASPTYYSRFNSGNDPLSRQLMASEQPVVSYSGGVAFSYKLNKRFSIQSGLYYSSVGQEVAGISSFGGFTDYDYAKGDHNFEVLTTMGSIYTNNEDVFLMANGTGDRIETNYTNDVFDPQKAGLPYINNNLRQNISYLELPVILRYKFVDKTIDFNLIGGVSYNILVNNSVYTMVDGGKYVIGETKGLNMFSLSSSLGMGMEYNFSENLSFNMEPTFRYYLNPFNQLTNSEIHPYSFGIFSGISYKF